MTYPRIEATAAHTNLAELHRLVTAEKVRVEVTCQGSSEKSVLISKDELDGLEKALELLSESQTYRAMASELTDIAGACRASV